MASQARRASSSAPTDDLGRRGLRRINTLQQVDCQGGVNSFRGRVLNVSRDGALISVVHRRFKAKTDLELVQVTQNLEDEFPDGLTLRFLECPVTVKASIIRVARLAEDGATALGCRFERPLTFAECRILGVRCDEKA
jgi:hypothetical protein